MGMSGSLLIFRVIGQRSRSNFNLDYISFMTTLLPLYSLHSLTNLNQSWYAVRKWGGLEAYWFSGSYVKGQGQILTLTLFHLWQPCYHCTGFIPLPILTKLDIQLGSGEVWKPIDFQGHRSKVKVKFDVGIKWPVWGMWARSLRFFNCNTVWLSKYTYFEGYFDNEMFHMRYTCML